MKHADIEKELKSWQKKLIKLKNAADTKPFSIKSQMYKDIHNVQCNILSINYYYEKLENNFVKDESTIEEELLAFQSKIETGFSNFDQKYKTHASFQDVSVEKTTAQGKIRKKYFYTKKSFHYCSFKKSQPINKLVKSDS